MSQNTNPAPGTVTLIGSGEMSPSMSKVHREVISKIEGPVRPAFLDTPAGFELNADEISSRAVEYFNRHLNLDLTVVPFKSAATAEQTEVESALRKLKHANYIFTGPGSPTYAIRNWRDTPIWEAITRRLASGAHLVFASAAAIAIGRYALPVYEIYKVGEDPRWVDGLDLFAPYGLELAIVPHWNNREGGTYDTRYCFMGQPRMQLLEENLPDSTTILGIDEYTACIVNLGNETYHVVGAGQVTTRLEGREKTYASGISLDLDQLRGEIPSDVHQVPIPPELADIWDKWPDEPEDEPSDVPFIELLVQTRTKLREAKQWALADEIRERLAELGIALEDRPTETTWRRT